MTSGPGSGFVGGDSIGGRGGTSGLVIGGCKVGRVGTDASGVGELLLSSSISSRLGLGINLGGLFSFVGVVRESPFVF